MTFRPRFPRRRRLAHDHLLRRRRTPRQITGWCLAGLGALMFFVGFVGSASGAITIPFDPHHILTQLGGLVAVIIGFSWAGSRRDRH